MTVKTYELFYKSRFLPTLSRPMYDFTEEKKKIFPKSIKSNKWCQTRCKVNKTFIMNDFYFHSDAFPPISEITFSRVFFTFAYFIFKLECQNLDLASNKKLVFDIYIHIQIFFLETPCKSDTLLVLMTLRILYSWQLKVTMDSIFLLFSGKIHNACKVFFSLSFICKINSEISHSLLKLLLLFLSSWDYNCA